MKAKKWVILWICGMACLGNAREVYTITDKSDSPERPYLAFPALLDLGSNVLVSYKAGTRHSRDPGATLDCAVYDPVNHRTLSRRTLAGKPNAIMQMGEWVRFADGTIVNYIDVQRNKQPSRLGVLGVKSTDVGKTFGPPMPLGIIDGVEYGYIFDHITEGRTTWMLAMTFSNLPGGTAVLSGRSPAGPVNVLRTDDCGKSWHFVRSVTAELGGAGINENAFLRSGDGFLIMARGYGVKQWLMRTDKNFNCVKKIDLGESPLIHSYIGRPRLYRKDGAVYLLGRNFLCGKEPMRLSLFRLNEKTLEIEKHTILDNLDKDRVGDGYYAVLCWRGEGDACKCHVITYKHARGRVRILDIVYPWKEIR